MAKGKEPKLRTPASKRKKKYAASDRKKARRVAHLPKPPRVERKADDDNDDKGKR